MKNINNFFNIKNIQFLAIFLFFLGCLFLSDEGKKPLIYTNDELRLEAKNNFFTFFTPKFLFNKGEYNFSVDFDRILQNNAKIELWKQSEKLTEWQILPNSNNFSSDFSLLADSQDVQFRLIFENIKNTEIAHNQQSTIIGENIKKVSIVPKTFFYSDTYFMIFLFLALAIFAQFYFCKHKLSQQQIIDFCLILGIAILCTFPFFSTTINYGIDLPYHFARIEGIKDAILDGQIGANILPAGCENYGSLNALYPYLFLYIPACLRLCNVSLLLSYKIFIFIINFLTATSVYICAKQITKFRLSIFLAIILYVFVPWRLVNIFSRAALGEIIAQIFWPFVIVGFYNIIVQNQKKWYFLAIGISGMLQSHINSTLMALIFCIFAFFAFFYKIIKQKRIFSFFKAGIFTIFLNLWFIIPFLFYFFNAKTNCTLEQLHTTQYFEGTLNLANLIKINLAKADAILGVHFIILLAICIFVFLIENKNEKSSKNNFFIFLLFFAILTIFATVSYFPNRFLMQKVKIFSKIAINFQYPIRLLAPASFFIIFSSLECFENSIIFKNYKKIIFAFLSICSIFCFLSITQNTQQYCYKSPFEIATYAHKEKLTPRFFYAREYNNEAIMKTYDKNYSMQKHEYFYNPNDFYPYPLASEKNVEITNFVKRGTKLSFCYKVLPNEKFENAKIENASDLRIEVPLQWYTGYKAFDENKTPLPITKSTLGKIQIPLNTDGKEHKIFVQYGKNPLFVIANIISAIFLCILAGYCFCRASKRKILK